MYACTNEELYDHKKYLNDANHTHIYMKVIELYILYIFIIIYKGMFLSN